jgi:hypothetical protein
MDFLCYLHQGWQPRLRPAEATRAWMDATPEAFAYRCLPLNIANAHGWEVASPCDFEAYWNGGSAVGDVKLRVPTSVPESDRPVSLFGQGTVTFHVQGLFRTPPGWNLWVGGSPNRAKDGIAPLTGVIETDWSPYTFTMNWRFTRRNHWVRFAAGEPICFLFPVAQQLPGGGCPENTIRWDGPVAEALLSWVGHDRSGGRSRSPRKAAPQAVRTRRSST